MATASVTNTFASQSGSIPLGQLDTNYLDITNYLNNPYNRNNFAVDTGTTNSIQIQLDAVPGAYTQGLEVAWKQLITNSGAPTLNVNSLGAITVLNQSGGPLLSGQFIAGGVYSAIYNGTAFFSPTSTTQAATTAASQAEMQTATSSLTFVTPANIKYSPAVAKASGWINGTATGTITGALGTLYACTASSSGTGTFNVVFTAAMADTQYAVLATPMSSAFALPVNSTRTTAGFTIITLTAATVAVSPVAISFSVDGRLA